MQKSIGEGGAGLYPQSTQQAADQGRKDTGEDKDEKGRGIRTTSGDATDKVMATADNLNN